MFAIKELYDEITDNYYMFYLVFLVQMVAEFVLLYTFFLFYAFFTKNKGQWLPTLAYEGFYIKFDKNISNVQFKKLVEEPPNK